MLRQWSSVCEKSLPRPLSEQPNRAGSVHGSDLHVCRSTTAIPGHIYQDVTWVSLKLTPVDILPKPTASKRPWRVHHLQTCHGPPGTQLHLQASCEIRGPGKPLGFPSGVFLEQQTRLLLPGFSHLQRGSGTQHKVRSGVILSTYIAQKMNPHRPTQ